MISINLELIKNDRLCRSFSECFFMPCRKIGKFLVNDLWVTLDGLEKPRNHKVLRLA